MEFTLNKSQRLVTNAALKDESRPVLTCVHIRKGIIEAANGFIAVQKDINYDGEEELLLKGKELTKCKDREEGVVFSKGEGTEIKAIGKDITILKAQIGTFPQIDKLYPTLTSRQVLKRLGGKSFQIALSRNQLLNLLKCLDEDLNGKENPVEIRTENAKGLIMPMMVRW